MTPSDIMRFKQVFPYWAADIVKWTPNKDGSMRIELTEKRFLIFTYVDDPTWKLETVRMHKKD